MASGSLDPSDTKNPFYGYTTVVVTYCSGDAHAGNVSQPWGKNGAKVEQRGYYNTKSVLDWASAQFPTLAKLTVSGSSAGSLGLQYWSRNVLEAFVNSGAETSVIGDSFIGVLYPPGKATKSETFLFDVWKTCSKSPLFDPSQQERCAGHRLLLRDVWAETMQKFPKVWFSSINSKVDGTQILFERAFELSAEWNLIGALMTEQEYYKSAVLHLRGWDKEPNYKSYLVDGNQHVYLTSNSTWLTTPLGPEATSGRPKLSQWLRDFVNPSTAMGLPDSVCLGPSKVITPTTHVCIGDTTYCAAAGEAQQ